MTCEQSRIYLHAFVDGELPVADHLRVEEHIAQCAECRAERDRLLALRSALQDLCEDLPPHFETRVRASLQPQRKPMWPIAIAAAALLAIGIAWTVWPSRSQDSLIARDVLESHVRSLQSDHLTDVPSSDHHTVKPWFQGKLDFSPPVPELGVTWPLDGGRLDYIDNRPVAALVYQRREHKINVYIWPSQHAGGNTIQQTESQGYNELHWGQGGMTWWVISDLNTAELREFARLLQQP